jgi:PAS domain S-box-containing protein
MGLAQSKGSIPEEPGSEYFRLLVESVRDYAIFALDANGRIKTWNEGARRIKGYDAQEIIGKHFSIFYPREDVDAGKCERELEGAALEGRFEDEGWRIRNDGSRFWANVIITALRGDAGQLVGFAKVTRDLTVRRTAEEEAQRFRLLVETVKDYGIFMLDPKGNVASWNAGAERLKGYTADEILGRHFSIFYPREDVDAGKCELELEGATLEGRFEDEGWRIRKDGSRFWANVVITALRSAPTGELVGFAKVTRDLTERRELEERMRVLAAEKAALEERARVHEFQERFVGVLGHDLRNPLASIEMGAGLLRQQTRDATTDRVASRMLSSARRMSRMIEQILDLTRSRLGGGLEVNLVRLDLCTVLTGIVDEMRAAHPDRTIEMTCPSAGGAWDRDRLEQVFSNLIGNAIHHGAKDAPVSVSAREENGRVHVEVHNTGPAIPSELLHRLFDPFRRGTRESRKKETEGLGLGLYISREIVLAHGGDIEARSSAPEGTTFTVTLPCGPPRQA